MDLIRAQNTVEPDSAASVPRAPVVLRLSSLLRGLTSSTTLDRVVHTPIGNTVSLQLASASSAFAGTESFLSSLSPDARLAMYDTHLSGSAGMHASDSYNRADTGCGGGLDESGGSHIPKLRFTTPPPVYLEGTAIFAQRRLQAVGCHASLLLEEKALCDDCSSCVPSVVDYCRFLQGCRLCNACDSARHAMLPCWSKRFVLIRSDVDETDVPVVGEKRHRDAGAGYYPYLLSHNEFVDHVGNGALTDLLWIKNRG